MTDIKINPTVKKKIKKEILTTCGNLTAFVQGVSKYIARNDKELGFSIPKNVWAFYQDKEVFIYNESMYETMVGWGISPTYLKKLGKYRCKTFPNMKKTDPDAWGTTGYYIDLIATVGTEIYLDYMKKHTRIGTNAKK